MSDDVIMLMTCPPKWRNARKSAEIVKENNGTRFALKTFREIEFLRRLLKSRYVINLKIDCFICYPLTSKDHHVILLYT